MKRPYLIFPVIAGAVLLLVILIVNPYLIPLFVFIAFFFLRLRNIYKNDSLSTGQPVDPSVDSSDEQDLVQQMMKHIPRSEQQPPKLRVMRPEDIAVQPNSDAYDDVSEFQQKFERSKKKNRDLEPWELPPEKPPWEL